MHERKLQGWLWNPVYTSQAVVKRVVQPVWQPAVSCKQTSNRLSNGWQPCWTNSCSFNRLSNRVVKPVWQTAVYTIQPFVKPVVKRVWQPAECLYRRYNPLSNRFDNRFDNGFDNRLYRVGPYTKIYYCGALLWRHRWTVTPSLYRTRSATSSLSQYKSACRICDRYYW